MTVFWSVVITLAITMAIPLGVLWLAWRASDQLTKRDA
jgi:hypothetical protein